MGGQIMRMLSTLYTVLLFAHDAEMMPAQPSWDCLTQQCEVSVHEYNPPTSPVVVVAEDIL